ncbi:MAG: DUF6541 family protein [Pseudonocardia sp.]
MLVGLYAAVLWGPGLLLGRLAGVRSWTLAAAAPLFTYAVAGIAGPLLTTLGIAWSPASAAAAVGGAALLAAAAYAAVRRVRPPHSPWSRRAGYGVAAGTAAVAAFGVAVVGVGIGRLGAIPQDWDAAFHANGIRWIADTGDASLTGMGRVNWYETGVEVFYPNAYHLVAAVVYRISGADIPSVLNAQTMLLPAMAALAVVALVHRFRGSPVLAVAAAACAVAVSAFYDMLERGPLFPFVTGVALLPPAVVLLFDLLDARAGAPRRVAACVFAVALAGLVCLNPAMLFSAVLLAVPAVVQRWLRWPRVAWPELRVVLAGGAVAAVLVAPQLLGSLRTVSGEPFDWPAEFSAPEAVLRLVTLDFTGAAQWALVVAAAIGLVRVATLQGLRWVPVVGLLVGVLFVLAASSDATWVTLVTRPWWNDRYRLAGLLVLPVALLAGHGIAELHRLLARAAGPGARSALAGAVAVVLVLSSTQVLYAERSVERMRRSVADGPVVSRSEADAMRALAWLVPPGERVLNDRYDGSVWMYALAGVQPVAGYYSDADLGPDARLLAEHFHDYADDPQVRAAVARLRVSTVIVTQGYVRRWYGRSAGLTDLDGRPWLQKVYATDDATVYRIRPCAVSGVCGGEVAGAEPGLTLGSG